MMVKKITTLAAATLGTAASTYAAAPSSADYLRRLEKWYPTAAQWSHTVPGDSHLGYYATGGHEHWAIQANCTAFAALAVMATAPELDEKAIGVTREQLRDKALGMMRYIFGGHKGNDGQCISAQKWGNSWIGALGLERMAHGVAALRPWLTPTDLTSMRRVLISESDFILKGYPVVGAIDNSTGRNKPESNIWNGSLLYRTATLYPDAPNAARYRKKATELMLNGISVPADADSNEKIAGKTLRQWHVGPNYTERYALNHHGYLNVGYMVICLSNIAMLHYFCRDYGIAVPPELYHHADRLWQLVKSVTFADGRLWRIGGDTRVRYCYCQDYALPAWIFIRDHWGDRDAEQFASGWLKLVGKEQDANPGGGFLTERLHSLSQVSPLYYCRLEGDRAAALSMASYWMRQYRPAADAPDRSLKSLNEWQDKFHGAQFVRGQRRLASWVWKSAERPTGLVAPADRSDLVEWKWNLAGKISGTGCVTHAEPKKWQSWRFDGGFATCGSYRWVSTNNPAEGTASETVAEAQTAFIALPDDATVIVLQQAHAAKPVYVNQVTGLYLNIPNDVYNDGRRTYAINGKVRVVAGAGGREKPVREAFGNIQRLEIDGRLCVQPIYGGELTLFRPGERTVNLAHNVPLSFSGVGANLYCDLVCMSFADRQTFYQTGQPIFDLGAAISIDGQVQTTVLKSDNPNIKIMTVTAPNRSRYLLAVNFGGTDAEVKLTGMNVEKALCGKAETSSSGQPRLVLKSGRVALLRLTL